MAVLLALAALAAGCSSPGGGLDLPTPNDIEQTPTAPSSTPTVPGGTVATPSPVNPPVRPDPGVPVIAIVPSEASVRRGDTVFFTVVVLANGAQLTGADVVIDVPVGDLIVGKFGPGDLLGATVLIGANTIDENGGAARLAIARIGLASAPTEPGNLALIEVIVGDDTAAGTYVVGLDVTLVDSRLVRLALGDITAATVRVR